MVQIASPRSTIEYQGVSMTVCALYTSQIMGTASPDFVVWMTGVIVAKTAEFRSIDCTNLRVVFDK
jgi:hypothetical protein